MSVDDRKEQTLGVNKGNYGVQSLGVEGYTLGSNTFGLMENAPKSFLIHLEPLALYTVFPHC